MYISCNCACRCRRCSMAATLAKIYYTLLLLARENDFPLSVVSTRVKSLLLLSLRPERNTKYPAAGAFTPCTSVAPHPPPPPPPPLSPSPSSSSPPPQPQVLAAAAAQIHCCFSAAALRRSRARGVVKCSGSSSLLFRYCDNPARCCHFLFNLRFLFHDLLRLPSSCAHFTVPPAASLLLLLPSHSHYYYHGF